ncbi:MAG TPA: fibronectin type III domain-containing protein [Candidatus Lokiarchaeia archaeon]|nr:fibronectin type III domain-containing protein [Candidatus Lokiarchaeia archaeon]
MIRNKNSQLIAFQVLIFITLVGIVSIFHNEQAIYVKSSSLQGPCSPSTVPGSSNPSGDEWPMFHRTLNHTGVTSTILTVNGVPYWKYTTGGAIWGSPSVSGGRVFIGSEDSKIYCLNATTGARLWAYNASFASDSCPAVADGCVYTASDDGFYYCLNATSGACIWNNSLSFAVSGSSPAIVDGRMYVGDGYGKIFCINTTTGLLNWSYSTGGQISFSSPAVAGGRVYVGSMDNKTYCLNATTGTRLWSYTTGGHVDMSSPTVAAGRVYFGSKDNNIYCLNATTGAKLWSDTTGGAVESSPAVASGYVIVESSDGYLHCLNGTTGAYIWSCVTLSQSGSSAAIADGMVYVGADKYLGCVNATTGAIIWTYRTGGGVISSPAIAGGRVYVGSLDNKLYCFPMILSNISSDPQYFQAIGGDGQVSLTWQAPADNGGTSITAYRIYQGIASNAETLYATVGNVVTFTSTGLTNGQNYYFKIAAVNLAGIGANSTEVYATPAIVPTAPQGLNVMAWGNAYVTLAWTTPASNGGAAITGYSIYRGITPGAETFLVNTGNVTVYNDTGLTNGQIYYYEVAAVNGAGTSALSAEVFATPATVPTAPQTLSMSSTGNRWIYLTWAAPSNNGGSAVINYAIYRGTSSGTEVLIATIGNVLLYNDTGLTNGQTYYYKVVAINAIGTSLQSAEVSGKPATIPAAPQTLSVSSTGNGWIYLTWAAPANNGGSVVTNYAVYRGTSTGSEVLVATIGNMLLYNDTGLTNGQTYYYEVGAVNAKGTGPQSAEVSGKPATVPTIPQTLAVSSTGNGWIYLTWTAPANNGGSLVTNYNIYRGISTGSEVLVATIGNVLLINDTGLANGQTYYYEVGAVNAKGTGPQSAEVSGKPATVPTIPQTLAVSSTGNGWIYLIWAAPANNGGSVVTNYAIYRGTSSNGEVLLTTIGNLLMYNDTGLTNGQTYYYKVAAMNARGTSVLSAETNGVPATVPTAPQAPAAAGQYTAIYLTWTTPVSTGGSVITGYRIYRGSTLGSESFLVAISVQLFYNNTGLANGLTYYYIIQAVNAKGNGANSTESSATTVTIPTAPQTLTTAPGDKFVILDWVTPASNGGSAITNYRIYVGKVSGGETLNATISGSLLTFNVTNLHDGQIYYFKVEARNIAGISPQSNEASATPVATINPPGAPTTLTVSTTGNGFISLTWIAPASNGGSPITNYNIYRGLTSGSEILMTTIGNVTTYTDNGLTNGQMYYYKVAAVNTKGAGTQSNEISGAPHATTPTAPQTLAVSASGNGYITLIWSLPASNGGSAITKYSIFRGLITGNELLVSNTTGPVVTYNDTGLINGQVYYYMVAAVNAIGTSAQSNEVSATPLTVPSAPLTFIVASTGNAWIDLTWFAPSNGGSPITGYRVYRGTSSGGETLLVVLSVVLNYNNTGLTNGQTYFYKVAAVNGVGIGANTTEAFGIPATVPTAPQTLAVSSTGNGWIYLTWGTPASTGGSTITKYSVYRGISSGVEVLVANTTGPVIFYNDTSLANGQTYFYKVAAVNSKGTSMQSLEVNGVPATVPTAPQTLSVSSTGNGWIHLIWATPANNGGSVVTNYAIYRGTSSNGEVLLTTIGNLLMCNDTGLTNGQTYYYKVAAMNARGTSARSAETDGVPATVPTPPQALSVAKSGNRFVNLTWSAPFSNGGSTITNYMIYRGNSSGNEIWISTIGITLTYYDTGLMNGQTYYYKVAAMNAKGNGANSTETSAKPIGPPSEPQNVTAIGQNNQVTLNWTTPASNGGASITGYRIYRGTTPDGEKLIKTIGVQLGYVDIGLPNGQVYYYEIAAINIQCVGLNATEVSAIPGNVPSAPQSFIAIPGNKQVTLNWTTPLSDGGFAITHYLIYRGTSSANEILVENLSVVTGFLDTGLTNGLAYYYRVAAKNSRGIGANSTEKHVTPATTPGVPQSFTAMAGNGQVVLTWTAPASNGGAAITNYNIYQGTISNGETLLATIGNVLTYPNAGLTNGQVYYFKIAAVNVMGAGVNATESSATPATVPDAPQKLAATTSTNQVVLTWQAPENNGGSAITNYNIYRATTSGGEVLIITVGNVLTWTDSNVTGGQLYYYRVSAVNVAGEGMQSSESSATPTSSGNSSPFFGLSSNMIMIIIGGACVVGIVVIASAGVASRKKKAIARSRANAAPAKSKSGGKETKQFAWIQPATTGPLALEEVKARLKHFFVFHAKTGVCLFYQPFIETTIDPQLITGFISAISTFGETFDKEAELKILEYKSFKILLEETVVCKYALLFSGDVNDELNELLKGFIGEFESRFKKSLTDFNGNVSMFNLASEIVSNVFKLTVPSENRASMIDKNLEKQLHEAAAPFNLYCPKCEQWLVKPGTAAVSGSETCPKCHQPLYFVPKCDNCGNGFVKPVREFNAFKNSPRKCDKCGSKMRIQ